MGLPTGRAMNSRSLIAQVEESGAHALSSDVAHAALALLVVQMTFAPARRRWR